MVWLGWLFAQAIQATIVFVLGWGAEDLHYYFTGEAGKPTVGAAGAGDAASSSGSGGGGAGSAELTDAAADGGAAAGAGGSEVMANAAPLSEYPHAGAWPIYAVKWVTDLFSPGNEVAFVAFFVAMCALLSGCFLWFLLRTSRLNGAWLWVGVCLLIGPILLSRLDLISGLCVGLGVAVAAFHPRIAGGILAFATASKLWPGVLAATFVGRWNSRGTWLRIVSFAAALAGLVGLTVWVAGLDRVLSPLTYQEVRGLQVESIAATPFAVLAVLDSRWDINFTTSKSFEITGPGVEFGTSVASGLMAATLVLAVGVAVWRFLHGGWTRNRALAFATVLVAMLIVSNKVFSPQYVLWLAPLVCLGVARGVGAGRGVSAGAGRDGEVAPGRGGEVPGRGGGGGAVGVADSRHAISLRWRSRMSVPMHSHRPPDAHYAQWAGYLLLVMAALSFLIFPITYSWLVLEGPKPLPVVFLVLRNLTLIAATVAAFRWWIATERQQPVPSGIPV